MKKIIYISTMHIKNGKCNADELYQIIEGIKPEVIFLEATEENYSNYDKYLFEQFGVYNPKLEIEAIQKYFINNPFEYIPVLDVYLPKRLDYKYNVLRTNIEFKILIDNFNFLASNDGFEFLNSKESEILQENLRAFEKLHFNDELLNKEIEDGIDTYENSMIDNILNYCKTKEFETAIFMCGVAHRKSINEKIRKKLIEERIHLNWQNYGN